MNNKVMDRYSTYHIGLDKKQSRFAFNQRIKTTFDSGLLIPLKWTEILPGDRFKISLNGVCHMQTPIKLTMDNAFLDVFAFWCPNRLLYKYWAEFMGENNSLENPWIDPVEHFVPKITYSNLNRPTSSLKSYTDLLAYLGAPPTTDETAVNALPVRMVTKVWNDYFRNQALQVPILLNDGEDTVSYVSAPDNNGIYDNTNGTYSSWQLSTQTGGACPPVNKFKDYFTTCVPSPQKAEPVYLPLGQLAPVMTGETNSGLYNYLLAGNGGNSLRFFGQSDNNSMLTNGTLKNVFLSQNISDNFSYSAVTSQTANGNLPDSTAYRLIPANLYADLSQATSATIEQLNQSIKLQQYYNILAQGGSRYVEILYSLYGVRASDARLQRAEYLGGKSIPITISAVAQTSSSGEGTPQGNLAGYSITGFDDEFIVNKFFEEHGILMFFGCVRTQQNYAQGLNRMWTRSNRFDYYMPAFNNLGYQPVMATELYANADKDRVFGYNEAWCEYRQEPSIATGLFNPDSPLPLTAWTYINDFANTPTLNSEFITQSKVNIDQTIVNTSATGAPQFWCDLELNNIYDRVMGAYSTLSLDINY